MKNILIATEEGLVQIEADKVVNGFAIHRTPVKSRSTGKEFLDDSYTVTHIESGYAVMQRIAYKKHAIDLCKRLNPVDVQAGWVALRDGDQKTFNRISKAIAKIVDEWANS